ncbi:unnamed protein product [Paramecium octaurelia]|uniref:Uncharacterized protein n=1 Tax=Paramecium octaurelia TaxID=43137 RepID=A0A8S1T987_PAROT|nr:unnamed protein product [Paramecium octaurelia]
MYSYFDYYKTNHNQNHNLLDPTFSCKDFIHNIYLNRIFRNQLHIYIPVIQIQKYPSNFQTHQQLFVQYNLCESKFWKQKIPHPHKLIQLPHKYLVKSIQRNKIENVLPHYLHILSNFLLPSYQDFPQQQNILLPKFK